MKFFQNFAVLMLGCFLLTVSMSARASEENFDANWLFLQADAEGAEQNNFADAGWRKLNVPHDWSIAGPFAETNQTGGAGAFLPSGTGWYRKHFSLPKSAEGKIVSIEFDGVMANSDVWINGFHLGKRPFGYVSFAYGLTGHLNFGGDNVIAVHADNSVQPASRWYAGAGIHRHVRLVVSDAVHLEHDGVFVSTPKISALEATVKVEAAVTNESASGRAITLQAQVISPDGKVEAVIQETGSIPAHSAATFSPQIVFSNPTLWNLDDPKLYRVVTEVVASGKTLDARTTVFGIRDAKFEPETGFWLNGKNFKVKGVCVHVDGGAFGDAVPVAIWEARLQTLKSLGVNAIRTAHNPPSPDFLDACDRLGFLVMDELFDCWTVGKPALDGAHLQDYHLYFNEWSKIDLADTVRRDRNHPCIILYSAGNEIHDTPNAALANKILTGLVEVFHANDPTRPVTQALFRPNVSHDYDNGLADLLDVVGQNYREQEILAAHRQKPSRKIIGTENTHTRQQWLAMRDNAPYAGQFLWTGIDYLGESRRWPLVGHGSGLIDRTGGTRPVAFERQSWWSDAPMVFIARRVAQNDAMPTDPGYAADERYSQVVLSDWTPRNPQPHNENVEIYSNAQEVELFLNGKSLGTKAINADASPRNWQVPFAPGTVKAVARNKGKIVATHELKTAGAAAKIILSVDKDRLTSDWNDVTKITATVTDKNGIRIPGANPLVSFTISGPGEIAAVDNADNSSHELFQAGERHAFQGSCVAFVKAKGASGKITLTADAPGLKRAAVSLKVSVSK